MSDPNPNQQPATPPRLPKPRNYILWVWIALLGAIILLLLIRKGLNSGESISQYQFMELLNSDQIIRATVFYDNQSPLNEIVGVYNKTDGEIRKPVRFRTRVRLTSNLEARLTHLPQFEIREANNVLLSLVWSILPILVIAVFIWFFFIRQMKIATKTTPTAAELHTRASQQQDHFEKILNKWDEQSKRMDGFLDKLENK